MNESWFGAYFYNGGSMGTIITGLCPKENVIFRHGPSFDTGMKLRLQEPVPSSYLSMISHLKHTAEQTETGHRISNRKI